MASPPVTPHVEKGYVEESARVRALEDEIVKLRADVVWIAQQRDENEQWARDRAAVAIQMADERDAARAEVERLKEEVNEQAAKHADCCVDRQDLQQAEARATALEAENERLRAALMRQAEANVEVTGDLKARVAASEEALAEMGNAMEAGAYDAAWTIRNAALARTTPAPEGEQG